MTKICGFVRTAGINDGDADSLQVMVQALQHHAGTAEEYLTLDHGGIALIHPTPPRTNRSQWDEEHARCLALCGHVVDLTNEALAPYRNHASVDNEDDASFLLHAFSNHGQKILPELNGVFAMAHYDATTKTLSIANDRYGFMPLYYYYDEQILVFASEVKAILRVTEQRDIDWESCADFFYIGHMMGQKTLFKHIHALEPGQMLVYNNATLQQQQYHDFTQTPVLRPETVSTTTLAALFTEAVRRRVRSDTSDTLLLSGGLDSRLILGVLHMLHATPELISLEHANVGSGRDGQYATQIAQELGVPVDYRRTRPDFLASKESVEVFYILDGVIPTWELFIGEVYPELAPGEGRVWDGLSLDLSLGGSRRIDTGTHENVNRFIQNRRTRQWLLRLILAPSYFRAMDRTFLSRVQKYVDDIPATGNQFVNFLMKHRVRRRIAVNPYQLYAAKKEAVTPTADKDFMDYVLGIPNSLRLFHRLYLTMMRERFAFLTKVPVFSGGIIFDFASNEHELREKSDTNTTGIKAIARRRLNAAVPARLTKRKPKLGPIEKRVTAPVIAPLIVSILERKNFDRPIYNKYLLRRLFAVYRNGNAQLHRVFLLVFYIELWHLLFIDKDSSISTLFPSTEGSQTENHVRVGG